MTIARIAIQQRTVQTLGLDTCMNAERKKKARRVVSAGLPESDAPVGRNVSPVLYNAVVTALLINGPLWLEMVPPASLTKPSRTSIRPAGLESGPGRQFFGLGAASFRT